MRFPLLCLLVIALAPCSGAIISSPLAVVEDQDRNPITTPAYLGSGNTKLFFRFDVPDGPSILSLNSFKVFVDSVDDDDRGDEGYIAYIGAGGNEIALGAGIPPSVAQFDADPSSFSAIIASIQNNNRLPIQLQRFEGDMYIQSVSIEIDANLADVPEPVSLLSVGSAVLLFGLARSVRRLRMS